MKGLPIQPFADVGRRSKRLIAGIPFDLVAVVCFAAVATALVSVLEISSSLVRAAVGLPLLFFVPGYVIVSALFPRATPVEDASPSRIRIRQVRGLSDVERVALSVGTSFAVLPLLGLAIIHSSWPLNGPYVVFAVACFATFWAVVAAVRRLLVPATERYRIGFRRRLGAVRTGIFGGESTRHVVLNVALVCSMVLALTVIGYGFVSPQQAEEYTDLQLLTENESGELVASGYPEEIESGEVAPLVVALDNREGETVNYTVVIQEQRLEDGAVVERTELQRYDTEIDAGESDHTERTLRPTTDDGDVRISVMVFIDDVPETPTHDDAYRYGHVWTSTAEETDVSSDTDLESDDGDESDDSADGDDGDETDSGDPDVDGDEDETDDDDADDSDEADDSDDSDEDEADDDDSGDEDETDDGDSGDEDETDDDTAGDSDDSDGDEDDTDDDEDTDDEEDTDDDTAEGGDESDGDGESDSDSEESDDGDDGIFDFDDGDDADDGDGSDAE